MTYIDILYKLFVQKSIFVFMPILFVGCGVNSGNPKGPGTTKVSLVLQNSRPANFSSFKVRIRGLQFIKQAEDQAPSQDTTQNVTFDQIKEIDLLDFSNDGKKILVSDLEMALTGLKQVRILTDLTHVGVSENGSGTKQTIHAIPLDLYAEAKDGKLPSGGRQSDQLIFNFGENAIKEGKSNEIMATLDLWDSVFKQSQLTASQLQFFQKEKKLTDEMIAGSGFLAPKFTKTQSITIAQQMNQFKIKYSKNASSTVCVYYEKQRVDITAKIDKVTRACEDSFTALPIRKNTFVGSLPAGSYFAVIFDDNTGIRNSVIQSLSIDFNDKIFNW